jgi:hypothetical protein
MGRVSRWPGSYALWAYGAPEPSHDVDLVVTESDVATAVTTLKDAGFAVEHPPRTGCSRLAPRYGRGHIAPSERPTGETATLDCAEPRDVLAITMPVLPPTMVLIRKLRASHEHHCDFAKLLPAVRAVRERLDWERIRSQTADNDYAVAFLVLADRLGLTE